jgi:hypothetical protein
VEASRRIAAKIKTRVAMSTLKRCQETAETKKREQSKRDVDLGLLPSPHVDANLDVEHDASEDKGDDSNTISSPIVP